MLHTTPSQATTVITVTCVKTRAQRGQEVCCTLFFVFFFFYALTHTQWSPRHEEGTPIYVQNSRAATKSLPPLPSQNAFGLLSPMQHVKAATVGSSAAQRGAAGTNKGRSQHKQ